MTTAIGSILLSPDLIQITFFSKFRYIVSFKISGSEYVAKWNGTGIAECLKRDCKSAGIGALKVDTHEYFHDQFFS